MSIVINGRQADVESMAGYMLNFKALCENPNTTYPTCSSAVKHQLQLSTKYYNAEIELNLVHLDNSVDDAVTSSAEGFILIVSTETPDLAHETYALSRRMVEADTGVRLLVHMQEEGFIATEAFVEWGLDNGFEYVHIDPAEVTESCGDREKVGLSRLLEALESTMWSTMQKVRKIPGSTPAPPLYVPSDAPDALPVPPVEDTAASPTASESTAQDAPAPPKAPTTTNVAPTKATKDPFDAELPDAEDNELVDRYSDFIAQATKFREQAVGGGMEDGQRRSQAAAMAMQLAQMMGMDDSSEEDA